MMGEKNYIGVYCKNCGRVTKTLVVEKRVGGMTLTYNEMTCTECGTKSYTS